LGYRVEPSDVDLLGDLDRISDLIAEPEGPAFISHKVARSRVDRLRFVTQDPSRDEVAVLHQLWPSRLPAACPA
jgi:hypothetical protein